MLLSERNPELDRHTRNRALPHSGLIPPVAVRRWVRLYQQDGCRALSTRLETPCNRIHSNRPDEPCVDPLYLFACGLSWRKHSNPTAGWELVGCLRSSGQSARLAAAWLAQAENIRPARTLDAPAKASLRPEAGLTRQARWWL